MHHFLKFVLKNWQVEWTFCIEELAGFTNSGLSSIKVFSSSFYKIFTKNGLWSFYYKNFRMPKDIFSDSNINKMVNAYLSQILVIFPTNKNPATFYLHWFSIDLNKNSQLGFLWTLGNLKTFKTAWKI